MRLFLISLLATLVLAAGCANNHPASPEVAPSQQANAGWSVPPGQKQAHAPGQAATEQTHKAPQSATASSPSAAQSTQQPVAEAKQPMVKPIVPAFPVRMQEPRVPELRMVHFGFDDWNLTPQARAILDANARWLKANPQVDVQIGGHCDERGSPEYNMALGERRARHVRDYLIRHGVPADNLTAVSFGEEMPLDPAHNEAAWAKNRRAEFHRIKGREISGSPVRKPSS